MEFMSQGLPVVVSRTKIDNYYFDESVVRFFVSGDVQGLADAICEVIENQPLREKLIAAGNRYVEIHSWDRRKREYLQLVDGLMTEVFSGAGARSVIAPSTPIDEDTVGPIVG
jgi:glycosyltransferase involved in cell wall biosynthesis